MPFDGSGNFTRVMNWVADAAANIKIRADRHDQEDNNFASGLSNVLTKDGQTQPTADIPLNAKKLVNVGPPTNPTDAATKSYVDGIRTFSSPIVISGSHPNAQLKFTGTTGPWGDSYVTADLATGVRGTDWVWNSKADFSGLDIMKLTSGGLLSLTPVAGQTVHLAPTLASADGTTGWNAIPDVAGWHPKLLGPGNPGHPSPSEYFFCQTLNYNGNITQIAYPYGTTTGIGAGIYYRGRYGGTWTAWKNLAATDNPSFTGTVTATGRFITNGGNAIESTTATMIVAATNGSVVLRPIAYNSVDKQTVVNNLGNMTVNGSVIATGNLDISGTVTSGPITVTGAMTLTGGVTAAGSVVTSGGSFIGGTQAVLAPTTPGNIKLLPNGTGSAVGQTLINTAGNMSVSGAVIATGDLTGASARVDQMLVNGGISTTGASSGSTDYPSGAVYQSANVSTAFNMARFYNPTSPYLNGAITTTAAATAYATSSDENFKELDAEMDPAQAIAIIRADPVLAYTWRSTGERAVGWFAQRSHAVDASLAVPPAYNEEELAAQAERGAAPLPGDEDYVPWGIDYGRRTPYLWAALSNALDRIDALEAKLSITDPKPPAGKKAA